MTYKLEVAAVGLCRHNVRIGGGISWKWSNGNELWYLVVVRNLFARFGRSSCSVSTAAVGQQFVDIEGGVLYDKKKWKIVAMWPTLIEVMAPSVLGVSNLKTASFLCSQACRKLSCAVMSVGGPLDRKTADVPVPGHMQNILCYMCTVPNLMGFSRALCIFAGLAYHHLGYPLVHPLMYMLNLCVVDNPDGIVARHIGQCTKFGRFLDIATDVVSETVFTGCLVAAALNSATLPAFLTGCGFWICLLVCRRFDTVGCFICIAIAFSGACWKDIRYPCPVARSYCETSVGGYSVYTGHHIFLAALYLAAEELR